jgi:hypothetical protein
MYFREFAGMVFNEQTKMAMFNDMDSFDKVFREWSKIEKDWEPKQIEDYEQKEISDECEEKENRV